MKNVMSNKTVIALYVLPALFLVLFLIYIPMILTGYYGLMKWDGVGEMKFIGLDNYIKLVQDKLFWESTWHSILLGLFSVLSLIGYLIVSLVLASKIKGANIFRKIYIIPMLLSSVAIAQLWIKIFDPMNGLINSFLTSIGVENVPLWLADPEIALYAIFIPIVWQYAGFYIIIIYAALVNVPEELIEAARIDGANAFQIAYKIKVPLISGVLKVLVILAIVGSLKYFDLIYVMTGGGPGHATEVMASYMYKEAFGKYNFGYGSAIGFGLLVISMVATWTIQKLMKTKEDN
ncbi:ABC transporter [Caldibacillus thermoamylovorans]|jgi:raffinose/stachyose/melibiose transport system permease protein|uniref:ABC transporter n=1 Tax=Caldibacillus thermoamylovorans TaxID=35841 RepID=A0A090IRR1_9BACI|nr:MULTISPECIES: sugar ABC transporter permease [Bacillaceae]MBU5343236.1 sugar ABC transporter permease [Caldifermentibacillus hisashii]MCB7070698.1 sugar ABC transporter permease [Caldibacillus sp. 210928-DFI.2.22]MCB7074243.1 sugar ABC transporter permease [Caldibacillus sp. 210928-DFI.2.18]MEC5271571.1 sugar ABC transporter permease [Caldifermentibacillus hisashii]PAC34879.1 sugar ABC transporter permease [Caldifermentibacillus hisashii]